MESTLGTVCSHTHTDICRASEDIRCIRPKDAREGTVEWIQEKSASSVDELECVVGASTFVLSTMRWDSTTSEQPQVQSGREAPKNADDPGQDPRVECATFQGVCHDDPGPLQCDLLSLVEADVCDPQTHDLAANAGIDSRVEMMPETSSNTNPAAMRASIGFSCELPRCPRRSLLCT